MIETCQPELILFDGEESDAPEYLVDHSSIRQVPLAGKAFVVAVTRCRIQLAVGAKGQPPSPVL